MRSGFFSDVLRLRDEGSTRFQNLLAAIRIVRALPRGNNTVILLPFRNISLLILLSALKGDRRIIYDELVNPLHWLFIEHQKVRNRMLRNLISRSYAWVFRRADVVLTDTAATAETSAKLLGVDAKRLLTVPCTTNENAFPPSTFPPAPSDAPLRLLFYGSGLPLHGIPTVRRGLSYLPDSFNCDIVFIGLDKKLEDLFASTEGMPSGAKISFLPRLTPEEVAEWISWCHINLAGPFGATHQAKQVTTTKTFETLSSNRVAMVGSSEPNKVFSARVHVLKVALGDPDSFSQELVWARAHQDQLSEIASNGHKIFEERFSRTRMTASLLEQGLGPALGFPSNGNPGRSDR